MWNNGSICNRYGKKNQAILLDCNTLEYKYSNLELKDKIIIIGNTNKRRGLADSKYNERRSECEESLKELKINLDINSLGELNEIEFEENKHLITNPINRKRAKHAVYENQRTLKAVKALQENDITTFGQLIIALKQKGTIGSRMTGAGFGGCTVSIVEKDMKDDFINEVSRKYKDIIGYEADFYVAEIGDGTRELV